jgi:pimeloyl-ACP methyl ester carboxylesterase
MGTRVASPGMRDALGVATLSLGDIDLYWERRGEGPRLLFLNGSGSTIESAGLLIDAFAASFEVVVHDQRGLGRTTVPERQPMMADFARDAAALLDHVGWEQANVFGISFGGMVAQELAVTWPARLDRLVLCCTSPGGEGGSSYPLEELASAPVEQQVETWTRHLDTRFDDTWLAEHPGDGLIVDTLVKRLTEPKTDEEQRGERMQVLARQGHDVWSRLDRITAPTLVVCGAYDGIAPRSNSEAIASRIPGAQLRCYEGGHLFVFQDPQALPDITGFLRSGSPAPAATSP